MMLIDSVKNLFSNVKYDFEEDENYIKAMKKLRALELLAGKKTGFLTVENKDDHCCYAYNNKEQYEVKNDHLVESDTKIKCDEYLMKRCEAADRICEKAYILDDSFGVIIDKDITIDNADYAYIVNAEKKWKLPLTCKGVIVEKFNGLKNGVFFINVRDYVALNNSICININSENLVSGFVNNCINISGLVNLKGQLTFKRINTSDITVTGKGDVFIRGCSSMRVTLKKFRGNIYMSGDCKHIQIDADDKTSFKVISRLDEGSTGVRIGNSDIKDISGRKLNNGSIEYPF